MNSRVKNSLLRILTRGNVVGEVYRVINKSKLAPINRKYVDFKNQSKRKIRIQLVPPLQDEIEAELLDQLRVNGWAKIPEHLAFESRRLLVDESERLLVEHMRIGRQKSKELYKDIWDYIVEPASGMAQLDINSPLIKYALEEPIIRIISNYLGEFPWLRYVIITESRYKDSDVHFSQKWHQDFDDVKMLKLFVYISDVNSEEDGPFKIISKKDSESIKNSFFHRHLRDEQVFSQIDKYNINTFIGKKCSSFLVDTSKLYHCGSRVAVDHSRLLYTALFTVYPSIYPRSKSVFQFNSGTDLQKRILAPELP